jgi:anti-sigma-K factor RskA
VATNQPPQDIERLIASARRAVLFWRFMAAMFAIASLGPLVMALHEGKLRGEVQTQLAQVQTELKEAQARPQVQYVAVLNDDQGAPAVLVTFDAAKQQLLVRRVGRYTEATDRSLQLWALPAGEKPLSLAVLGKEDRLSFPAQTQKVSQAPALAISLEPKGGVPSEGGPTGPVLFKGALLQTPL